jgi:isopentenyl phosphate kinase
MNKLTFLKLGGSLITDKNKAHTALLPQIDLLVFQIEEFLFNHLSEKLVLGHGSGSFGHQTAHTYNTRQGVHNSSQWKGFTEVWSEARALNQIVIERLQLIGLPVIAFPFSASGIAEDQRISTWDAAPIQAALDAGLLPVIYGDVALDKGRGGTIVSTEEQFEYLAPILHPGRVLLAGIEPGIWQDFPKCEHLLPELSLTQYQTMKNSITASASVDVTGGMASKVDTAFAMIQKDPELTVQIFSGQTEGTLLKVLNGEKTGTILTI